MASHGFLGDPSLARGVGSLARKRRICHHEPSARRRQPSSFEWVDIHNFAEGFSAGGMASSSSLVLWASIQA